MDIKTIKKIVSQLALRDAAFVKQACTAERYFLKDNDILTKGKITDQSGWRIADNRIPSNFFYILITSKVSYLLGIPPTFDVGDEDMNNLITKTINAKWPDICYKLGVATSLAGRGYLHVWINSNNEIDFGVVDSKDVEPIKTNTLSDELAAIVYQHTILDQDTGDFKTSVEYWDDQKAYFYEKPASALYDDLQPYQPFSRMKEVPGEFDNEMTHGMGCVPFIEFKNNYTETSDLNSVKELIDAYDKVFSGYVDDLEDVQQIILALKGYEGEDLEEFSRMLRKYKAIKLEDNLYQKTSIEPISINIPVEARNSLLDLIRKRIFEDGQGIDPDPQFFGNSSGVALKHLYDNLELKCKQMESSFKKGFEQLIRLICRHHGFEPKYINQQWRRNIEHDHESEANLARQISGIVSQRTQLSLLSFVDNPEAELELIRQEEVGY